MGSATPPIPKRAELQRSPILGVLSYLCLHPLTQNDQIWHAKTEGRVLGGQPRHCICTNASRALSASSQLVGPYNHPYNHPCLVSTSRSRTMHVSLSRQSGTALGVPLTWVLCMRCVLRDSRMGWLYIYYSTSILPLFDGRSTAYQRSLRSQ